MKTQVVIVALALLAAPVLAQASCDAVKASIDAKIKANGVSNYTLTVEPAGAAATDGKVVGQCEGDKQIVYARGASGSAPASPARTSAKPAAADEHGSQKPATASTSG